MDRVLSPFKLEDPKGTTQTIILRVLKNESTVISFLISMCSCILLSREVTKTFKDKLPCYNEAVIIGF